jgi:hypothetical protein
MAAMETAAAARSAQFLHAIVPPIIRARAEVRRNNATVLREHEDFFSWVSDEDHFLHLDLRNIDESLRIEDMRLSEAFWHSFSRKRTWPHRGRIAWPDDPHAEEIANLVARWRAPEEGGNGPEPIEEPR